MMSNIDTTLLRRLQAELDRHPDVDEAARTALWLGVNACFRSVGFATTAEFMRDTADYIEKEAFAPAVVMQ